MSDNNQIIAAELAKSLPACDNEEDGTDLISLCDLVITGVEAGMTHWWVRKYNYRATGEPDDPWATLEALPSARADPPEKQVVLDAATMRQAVETYLKNRLDRGTSFEDARLLINGSYTDALVADSVLQFALYGKEVYN